MLRIPVKQGRRRVAFVYAKDLAAATAMLNKDWCAEWVEIMVGAVPDGTGKYVGGTPKGRWEIDMTWEEHERRNGLAVDSRIDVMTAQKLMGFQRELILAKAAANAMDAKTASDIMADIMKG